MFLLPCISKCLFYWHEYIFSPWSEYPLSFSINIPLSSVKYAHHGEYRQHLSSCQVNCFQQLSHSNWSMLIHLAAYALSNCRFHLQLYCFCFSTCSKNNTNPQLITRAWCWKGVIELSCSFQLTPVNNVYKKFEPSLASSRTRLRSGIYINISGNHPDFTHLKAWITCYLSQQQNFNSLVSLIIVSLA